MKYFIPFILPILIGCTSNKEIINYTQNNAKKLDSIKTLNYIENSDYTAITKKLDNHNILIAINPKDRDKNINIYSCKINKNTTTISTPQTQNDNLPKWFDRYIVTTTKEIKKHSKLKCTLSNNRSLVVTLN